MLNETESDEKLVTSPFLPLSRLIKPRSYSDTVLLSLMTI